MATEGVGSCCRWASPEADVETESKVQDILWESSPVKAPGAQLGFSGEKSEPGGSSEPQPTQQGSTG